jgi:hypothetical protein
VLALLAGVATSARVVVVLVPALGIVAAVVAAISRRRQLRTAAAVAVAAVVAGGAVYGAMRGVYPNSFVGAWSSQSADILAPNPTAGTPAIARGDKRRSKTAKPGSGPATRPAQPTGVQLLPGRAEQLRLAERRSHDGSVADLLIGDGMGTSKLDPSITDPNAVPYPERTGETWIGRVLTECGWVGLVAFFGLLGWLTILAWRLWSRTSSEEVAILALAFPVITALTVAGAAYTTILDVRAYSVAFWVLTGLLVGAVSADRTQRLLASSAGGVAEGD